MLTIYLRISTILVCAVMLFGCDSHSPSTYYAATTSTVVIHPQPPKTVWDRMAMRFTFPTEPKNPRVARFIKQYSQQDYTRLAQLSEQARPHIYHIITLLEERGLPPELALLPIIESEYRPTATSNMGAVGIWQLMPLTGQLYGVQQDQWYDGRKDLDAATKAALDHLEFFYKKFNKDWLLALAAYNAGGGRVSSAIRANKNKGKPTDYWSLNLPQQTLHFVPKFLALVHLIQNYRHFGIDLAPIPNKPYFTKVQLEQQIDLKHAATLAELDVKEVKKLNAAYRAQVTHPKGPQHITLPVKNVSIFKANFANQQNTKAKPATAEVVHTVNHGDTLHLIASKYRTTVQSIKHKNRLKTDIIRSGQQLAI